MPHPEIHSTPSYRKAFAEYMRRGTPIEYSLQAAAQERKASTQEHPATHYFWRTRGDNKVRAAHAANNGRIFSWDNPPVTGHPGEDFGCRCWAEPYGPRLIEADFQTLISPVNDNPRWGWDEFFNHYFNENGDPVTLPQIGHLQAIIDHVARTIYNRVRAQIVSKARSVVSGAIADDFIQSYSFYGVSWAHGDSTLSGDIYGGVARQGQFLLISITVMYKFSDMFEDIYGFEPGTPYPITGWWKTRIEVIANMDESASRYKKLEDQ
jgi:Phage Mu protein F like protein